MLQPRLPFFLYLFAYTLVIRLLPYVFMNCDIQSDPTVLYYPWNFSPLTAICLFSGAILASRQLPLLVPLGILFLSDLGILAISGQMEWAFPPGRWAFTYFCFTIAAVLGMLLRRWQGSRRLGYAISLGVAFEVVFFAVSNFLVWAVPPETPMYPFTAAGLMQSYFAALPFFGKSLLGTAAFTGLLFSPLGIRAASESRDEPSTGELARVRVK